MASETVNRSAGLLNLKRNSGSCFILLSIASNLDAEKTLAINPDTVAMIAKITVNHKPKLPNTGWAASASA